jgi:hypothetical protein
LAERAPIIEYMWMAPVHGFCRPGKIGAAGGATTPPVFFFFPL